MNHLLLLYLVSKQGVLYFISEPIVPIYKRMARLSWP